MKIDQTHVSQSLLPGRQKKVEDEKPAIGFDNVLSQQMKATPAMSGIHQSRPQPAVGLSPAAPVTGTFEFESVQRVDQLLDTIENYGQLLSDSGSTMRAIEPTVRRMKIQAASLDQLLQNLPEADPMRQVLAEARTLVHREVERFDSGYYVDP